MRVLNLIVNRPVLLFVTDVQTVTRERGGKPLMHIYHSKRRLWEPFEHK